MSVNKESVTSSATVVSSPETESNIVEKKGILGSLKKGFNNVYTTFRDDIRKPVTPGKYTDSLSKIYSRAHQVFDKVTLHDTITKGVNAIKDTAKLTTRVTSIAFKTDVILGNVYTGFKATMAVAAPFLITFGISSAAISATALSGGAVGIAIVFIIIIIAKIQKKRAGQKALDILLDKVQLIFTQLVITNSVITELSELFNINLNQSILKELISRLDSVTKYVLSLFPLEEESKNTITKYGRRFMSYTNKFFNQDRLTNEIYRELTMINGLFTALYTQMEFQLKEIELVCDDPNNKNEICTFSKFPNENIPAVEAIPMDSNDSENEKDNTILQINRGGLEANEISNTTQSFNTYKNAYLEWTKRSDNYKKLKFGNMESIRGKIIEKVEPTLNSDEVKNAAVATVEIVTASINSGANDETNNDSTLANVAGVDTIGNNSFTNELCSNPPCNDFQGGGGTLFFFEDIRKMLQKNRDAINSFLTNRNARKTRKGKRIHKTRNGRKARKHSTIYKRKARKHTNTRRN